MQRRARPALLVLLLILATSVACAQVMPINSIEAAAWSRYLVPLPRTLSITGKIQLDPATVAVVPVSSTDIVINQAGGELKESLGRAKTAPNPPSPAFTITLQLGGAESTPLQTLRNPDQAYLIQPEPGNTGLRIVAIGARGLYYGAKTVQQLIAAYDGPGSVRMPILTVTDYPQLTDRGLWGNDSHLRTRWMADRKMNYQEQIGSRSFDGDCVAHAGAKPGYEVLYQEGPYYGVQPCYSILHLEQNSGSGMFTCYPILQGVSAAAGVWCYSRPAGQPTAVDVLAWWIADLKNIPNCTDADVWMSESVGSTAGCKCSTCSPINRSLLEIRTIVAGWKKAMQTAGPIGLRIMTTESTRADNDLIVQELGSDPTVKIWHYDSLKTYLASEMQIVDADVATWAANGRYAGEVPILSAFATCWQPWTCPQFVRYRMQEFKNKNISGLLGYPTPGIAYNRFNVEAAAEWSWNPDGRSNWEFAVSWASRQGLTDPEKFASWCDLMGPVSWDVYGSEFPRGILRNNSRCGPIATALQTNTLQALGTFKSGLFPAPWGDIKSVTQFNNDVANASKALDLAKQMNVPEFKYESLVVHGYITALRALYELKSLVVGGAVAQANRAAAANYFYIYVSGMKEAKDALPKWATAIGVTTDVVTDAVAVCTSEISQMTSLASALGCPISSSSTLVPISSIPEAKKTADGTFVSLGSEVVTSTTNGVYIQEIGGTPSGIKIQTSLSLTVNTPYAILGTLGTSNGERYLNVTMAVPVSDPLNARPMGIKTSGVGGGAFGLQPAVWEYSPGAVASTGINNTGVLVKIAGKVTAKGSDYFYVDDGCNLDDGSGHRGIRVLCGAIIKPDIGDWVTVQGVSSTYYERSHAWRAIVVPSAGNITPI